MKHYIFALYASAALVLLATPRTGASQDANASYKLQVHASYTGSGTVDQTHKVYVVLWNRPSFTTGDRTTAPVAIKSIAEKDGTATFDNILKTPVYVSAVYDPTGSWDAQSPPPDGSSLGLYRRAIGGAPQAIELKQGETASIDLAFDDSVKMRGGKPEGRPPATATAALPTPARQAPDPHQSAR